MNAQPGPPQQPDHEPPLPPLWNSSATILLALTIVLFVGGGIAFIVAATSESDPVPTARQSLFVEAPPTPVPTPTYTLSTAGTPTSTPTSTGTTTPTATTPSATKTTPTATGTAATDPRFPTCAEANREGYGPYYPSDDEFLWYQDRDGDGVACEQ